VSHFSTLGFASTESSIEVSSGPGEMEDEHFDLEKLAKILNMTRITLYRKLKKISRFTPNELINMVRLQKAAEMLTQGEYKIYEVASMVGFH